MDERGHTLFLATPEPGEIDLRTDSGPIYLLVLAGGIPGAMLPLSRGNNVLGRGPESDLNIVEASISRRHASFHLDENGVLSVADCGSTNGTFLNGHRLEPNQLVPLNDGDRVRFGSTVVLKVLRPDPLEERFQREMYERAVRDGLTGLFNRRFFFEQVESLAERARSGNLGLALLMLDLDHFKRVNDTYGHDAGDAALRELANVLRQGTRSEDLLARFGGEEFLLAFPSPSVEHAYERAERICQTVAGRRFRFDRIEIHLTVSIGVAFTPAGSTRTARALVSMADLHLAQAKEGGRNRVMGPLLPPPGPNLESTVSLETSTGLLTGSVHARFEATRRAPVRARAL